MADLSRASRPYGDRLRVHHLGPLEQGNGPLRLALIEDVDQMTVAISVALIQRRVRPDPPMALWAVQLPATAEDLLTGRSLRWRRAFRAVEGLTRLATRRLMDVRRPFKVNDPSAIAFTIG